MTVNKKEDRVLIAVYGSLREGLHNHILLKNSLYIGEFSSSPVYTMYDLGAFPTLVEGGNTSIEFEVYAVNKETAKRVDSLEGYNPGSNHNHYNKTTINTPFGKAYVYVYDKAPTSRQIVESGNWVDHQATKISV